MHNIVPEKNIAQHGWKVMLNIQRELTAKIERIIKFETDLSF